MSHASPGAAPAASRRPSARVSLPSAVSQRSEHWPEHLQGAQCSMLEDADAPCKQQLHSAAGGQQPLPTADRDWKLLRQISSSSSFRAPEGGVHAGVRRALAASFTSRDTVASRVPFTPCEVDPSPLTLRTASAQPLHGSSPCHQQPYQGEVREPLAPSQHEQDQRPRCTSSQEEWDPRKQQHVAALPGAREVGLDVAEAAGMAVAEAGSSVVARTWARRMSRGEAVPHHPQPRAAAPDTMARCLAGLLASRRSDVALGAAAEGPAVGPASPRAAVCCSSGEDVHVRTTRTPAPVAGMGSAFSRFMSGSTVPAAPGGASGCSDSADRLIVGRGSTTLGQEPSQPPRQDQQQQQQQQRPKQQIQAETIDKGEGVDREETGGLLSPHRRRPAADSIVAAPAQQPCGIHHGCNELLALHPPVLAWAPDLTGVSPVIPVAAPSITPSAGAAVHAASLPRAPSLRAPAADSPQPLRKRPSAHTQSLGTPVGGMLLPLPAPVHVTVAASFFKRPRVERQPAPIQRAPLLHAAGRTAVEAPQLLPPSRPHEHSTDGAAVATSVVITRAEDHAGPEMAVDELMPTRDCAVDGPSASVCVSDGVMLHRTAVLGPFVMELVGELSCDVLGLFHPSRYMEGRDCIEYPPLSETFISRSHFEKVGGAVTAKWYRSIRVVPNLENLGQWLQRHGLPFAGGVVPPPYHDPAAITQRTAAVSAGGVMMVMRRRPAPACGYGLPIHMRGSSGSRMRAEQLPYSATGAVAESAAVGVGLPLTSSWRMPLGGGGGVAEPRDSQAGGQAEDEDAGASAVAAPLLLPPPARSAHERPQPAPAAAGSVANTAVEPPYPSRAPSCLELWFGAACSPGVAPDSEAAQYNNRADHGGPSDELSIPQALDDIALPIAVPAHEAHAGRGSGAAPPVCMSLRQQSGEEPTHFGALDSSDERPASVQQQQLRRGHHQQHESCSSGAKDDAAEVQSSGSTRGPPPNLRPRRPNQQLQPQQQPLQHPDQSTAPVHFESSDTPHPQYPQLHPKHPYPPAHVQPRYHHHHRPHIRYLRHPAAPPIYTAPHLQPYSCRLPLHAQPFLGPAIQLWRGGPPPHLAVVPPSPSRLQHYTFPPPHARRHLWQQHQPQPESATGASSGVGPGQGLLAAGRKRKAWDDVIEE
ncbi:hypothetical protein TSOC_011810 [Tetrabaena socialis]|uniref:Uncharacterized protein n=1 Tax=Tetrabaena socialis TaxID=47790 RepID=A0A2J7ZPN9_9CHLO|nr:hypothetical protein TSOC_011810 [Tetrabaena socialis]|eukprot:PNH02229.1 hypothetical protein TSOC_011810 [Tetrabaena socialis]